MADRSLLIIADIGGYTKFMKLPTVIGLRRPRQVAGGS